MREIVSIYSLYKPYVRKNIVTQLLNTYDSANPSLIGQISDFLISITMALGKTKVQAWQVFGTASGLFEIGGHRNWHTFTMFLRHLEYVDERPLAITFKCACGVRWETRQINRLVYQIGLDRCLNG